MNSINFLLSDSDLISARSKTITLRQLDKERVRNEYMFWQMINLVIPILIIILLGIILNWYRKKKYKV